MDKNNKKLDIKAVIKIAVAVLIVCLAWQIVAPIIGLGVHIITSIIALLLRIAIVAVLLLFGVEVVKTLKNKKMN